MTETYDKTDSWNQVFKSLCVCGCVYGVFFVYFFLFLVQVNIPFAVFIAVHSSFSDVYI